MKKIFITFLLLLISVSMIIMFSSYAIKTRHNNNDNNKFAESIDTNIELNKDINYNIEYYYDKSISIKYIKEDDNNYHFYQLNDDKTLDVSTPVFLNLNNAFYFNNQLNEVSKEDFILKDDCTFKIYYELVSYSYPLIIHVQYIFI